MSITNYREYFRNEQIYDHEIESVDFIETHISLICLTGEIVYKVKKPVKMGEILDFRNIEERQYYCRREVELNSRFSPELYYGVVGLTEDAIISDPSSSVEFAVKMKQLPQTALMSKIIDTEASLSNNIIKILANKLIEFYERTETYPEAGSISRIREKIDENFATLSDLDWSQPNYKQKVYEFLEMHTELFEQRQSNDRIIDGHGDLRPKNIFVLDDRVVIFDCIEFNDLLRYVDVAEDIGFLLMELEKAGLINESRLLEGIVQSKFNDSQLSKIITFYKSYRAAVRTKVKLFRITELDEKRDYDEIQKLYQEADTYTDLAIKYMEKIA